MLVCPLLVSLTFSHKYETLKVITKSIKVNKKHLVLPSTDPGSYFRVKEDVTDAVKQVVE